MFFAHSGLQNSRIPGSLVIAAVYVLSILSDDAKAHLELYHNVEVNLTEAANTGKVRLYFTIHAPELLVGFDNAGSEIFDAEWLRTRSDEEFQTLFERGRTFVKEKFAFGFDTDDELDLIELLKFEKPETIRDKDYQSGVPVGCLLVSAELIAHEGTKQMSVKLKKGAGKRLLLVCTRKGSFPETKDMEGGDLVEFVLPERQVVKLPKTNVVTTAENGFSWAGILGFIGMIVFVFLWRSKRLTR